jgi:hypothetical protein
LNKAITALSSFVNAELLKGWKKTITIIGYVKKINMKVLNDI